MPARGLRRSARSTQAVAGAVNREPRRVGSDGERVCQPDAVQAVVRDHRIAARDAVPGGTEVVVSPGRMPSRHVLPPSFEVEKATLAAPPVRFRPFWKSATVVAPTVWESGSTCVSCWLSAFDCRSRWMRVLTTSQSL